LLLLIGATGFEPAT